MKVKSESEVAQSRPTLATPWTAAYQAPPSMGFSRQKYWSGVPLPSPSILLSSDFLSLLRHVLGHFSRVQLFVTPMDSSQSGSAAHGIL